jgi:hypothetical protein
LKILKAGVVDKVKKDDCWKTKLLKQSVREKRACVFIPSAATSLTVSYESFKQLDSNDPKEKFIVKTCWNKPLFASMIKAKHAFQDIETETKELFKIIEKQLESVNMTTSNIFIMHCYVKSMSEFSLFNTFYKTYFGANPTPRVTVEANIKNHIMIDYIACINTDNLGMTKENIHVQGISYWAPANIGYI